jgi:pimeloyl-ACP methyl ester carboxylesterase
MSPEAAIVSFDRPLPVREGFWKRFGRGAAIIGRALGRGGQAVGKTAASAYSAIDPDVRLHIAQLPVVGMSMLLPRAEDIAALPDDGCRPVVFVHGLGGQPGNFIGMKTYFKLLGRTRVYLVDLTGAGSFDEMSARVSDVIERVVVCNGLGPDDAVDVVAHSMGGIAARLALRDPAIAGRVQTLVTLGTPHSGTYLARFAATDVTLDLRPKSPLMDTLSKLAEGEPKDVRIVAMWSPADVFILPAEGAQLAGAENIELAGFTHYSYLMRRRGWKTVFETLTECGE